MSEAEPIIYIFGDSHAKSNTNNLKLKHVELHTTHITMNRIGRDNIIPRFENSFNNVNNTFIFFYGEIDIRNHIYRQINTGRRINEIINSLVTSYFNTIKNNIIKYNKIIIANVDPPNYFYETGLDKYSDPYREDYHKHGGTNEERLLWAYMLNNKLRKMCELNNYIFLDTFDYYINENGYINYNYSSDGCHIDKNEYINKCIEKIMNE